MADRSWPSRSTTAESTASASPGGAGGGVVAVQLGCGAGAGDGVGALGRNGEHVSKVDAGSARQGDVGVLAVLGAAEHGQAGGHGAALRDVDGDRVAEFGIFVGGEQEVSVRPASL